jgi:uncharacterized alkaline shock family protein YloU
VDAFNRIVVLATAALALVCAVAALLVTADVLEPTIAPAGWLRDGMRSLDRETSDDRNMAMAIAAAAALGSLALLALELRPLWHKERYVLVDAGGKSFELNPKAIEHIVEREGSRVRGVQAVRPQLKRNGSGLEIDINATVRPAAELPGTKQTLETRVRQAVEQMTGLPVSNVNVRMKHSTDRPRVV